LASGTRAKLNKSEMNRIEVRFPNDELEQTAIATVLSNMDGEITALEQRRDKTRALKQAMMQELLTGKTRLVSAGGSHA
jgi:type I restriction enzyme S subunit